MDHNYENSNSIIGIYIHELAYIPIFKAFAHFLAELAQVAETHIDVYMSSEISSHNFQSLSIMKYGFSSKVADQGRRLHCPLGGGGPMHWRGKPNTSCKYSQSTHSNQS